MTLPFRGWSSSLGEGIWVPLHDATDSPPPWEPAQCLAIPLLRCGDVYSRANRYQPQKVPASIFGKCEPAAFYLSPASESAVSTFALLLEPPQRVGGRSLEIHNICPPNVLARSVLHNELESSCHCFLIGTCYGNAMYLASKNVVFVLELKLGNNPRSSQTILWKVSFIVEIISDGSLMVVDVSCAFAIMGDPKSPFLPEAAMKLRCGEHSHISWKSKIPLVSLEGFELSRSSKGKVLRSEIIAPTRTGGNGIPEGCTRIVLREAQEILP